MCLFVSNASVAPPSELNEIISFSSNLCFLLVIIGADLPGAVGANAPKGKGLVGACTQRKN